jgi:hypothetical protein
MLQACVQKGAAWLSEKYPRWAEQINLEILDLDDSRYCICGQMYTATGDKTFLDELWNNELGFWESYSKSGVTSLTDLWKDEIYWRIGDEHEAKEKLA